jgi:hypothetical protein
VILVGVDIVVAAVAVADFVVDVPSAVLLLQLLHLLLLLWAMILFCCRCCSCASCRCCCG